MDFDDTPDLYVKRDDSYSFGYTRTDPPCSIVGERYLEMNSPAELLFVLAKHLAYHRPGRRMRWITPSLREIQLSLLAGLKLGVPSFGTSAFFGEILDRMVENLGRLLDDERLAALRRVAERLVALPAAPSIERWIAGIEHTACRAALVYCGDLAATVQLIKTHTFDHGGPPGQAKIADLIAYGVSKRYTTLKEIWHR
jgi:hypothetical protein